MKKKTTLFIIGYVFNEIMNALLVGQQQNNFWHCSATFYFTLMHIIGQYPIFHLHKTNNKELYKNNKIY